MAHCEEDQSPPSPKDSAWHAAQLTTYGRGWVLRRLPIYPMEFACEGVKDVPLRKQ